MKMGAQDATTTEQHDLISLGTAVKPVQDKLAMSRELETLRSAVSQNYGLDELIGESPAMARVYRLINKALRGDITVAIQGESGTGKELVAKAIHFNSPRRHGPFIVVNCAAVPHE